MRKEEVLLEVCETLVTLLEGEEKAQKVRDAYWNFIPPRGEHEISREVHTSCFTFASFWQCSFLPVFFQCVSSVAPLSLTRTSHTVRSLHE